MYARELCVPLRWPQGVTTTYAALRLILDPTNAFDPDSDPTPHPTFPLLSPAYSTSKPLSATGTFAGSVIATAALNPLNESHPVFSLHALPEKAPVSRLIFTTNAGDPPANFTHPMFSPHA